MLEHLVAQSYQANIKIIELIVLFYSKKRYLKVIYQFQ